MTWSWSLALRLSLALAVMAAMCAASSAQQQQPPPPSCSPAQASLAPCISYFIGNSSSPSAACCTQIQAMFQSQAPCLCAAAAAVPSQLSPAALGQALPSACDLPADACTDVTGATSSSAAAPPAGGSTAPSSGTPVAAAPMAGRSGTAPAGPSGGGGDSGGVKSVPTLLDSGTVGAELGLIISTAGVFSSFLLACACVF